MIYIIDGFFQNRIWIDDLNSILRLQNLGERFLSGKAAPNDGQF